MISSSQWKLSNSSTKGRGYSHNSHKMKPVKNQAVGQLTTGDKDVSNNEFNKTLVLEWFQRSFITYLTSVCPIIIRLTSSSRILGVLICTAAEGEPNTWDLDACHVIPAEELNRPSLSMGCVTLILIVPSSNWATAGIEEAALARELCVRSR